MKELRPGWVWTTLGEIAEIGPGIDRSAIDPTTLVSFVPMASVEAGSGTLDASATREWQQVSKASEADGKIVEKIDSTYMDPTDFSQIK